MNSTNRPLNRLFLIVIGVLLWTVGSAAIAVTTVPRWDQIWRSTTPSIEDTVTRLWRVGLTFAGVPNVPWALLAIPVAALILIVLLLVFSFAQGRGRTSRVVEAMALPDIEPTGTITVDTSLAADVIQHAVGSQRDIAAVSVSAYRVRGKPALKVRVTPRRGASPMRVLAAVESAAAEWDEVLGVRVPVFVHVAGGLRASVSKTVRTV
ncbi:MAG TPA: hypothetical protein VGC18_14430 [Lacisediminihabitans sp.]|uniref:hypothetical protein n=1 Tax=Lacisediminihabitans sp. TaxID=2787631 RepID=UPI002ED9FA83